MSLFDLRADSIGVVTGEGPGFTVAAGQMTLEIPEGESDAHILLKNGVKLVYTPVKEKE
ncbi:hypothetical protein [Lentibacter algarum]|jgi:hypothetical protein